jgi:hypothetical protein
MSGSINTTDKDEQWTNGSEAFSGPVLTGTIGAAPAIARRAGARQGGHNAPPGMAPRSPSDRGNQAARSIRSPAAPLAGSSSHVVQDDLSALPIALPIDKLKE